MEDAEWDRAAEAEILAANEGFNDDLHLVDTEMEKKNKESEAKTTEETQIEGKF